MTALRGTKRKGSASAHIARGFTAAALRSDARCLHVELDQVQRSSRINEKRAQRRALGAYDSVFRVAESELSAEGMDRRSRVRVGKKGNAPDDRAREAAFEATLRHCATVIFPIRRFGPRRLARPLGRVPPSLTLSTFLQPDAAAGGL